MSEREKTNSSDTKAKKGMSKNVITIAFLAVLALGVGGIFAKYNKSTTPVVKKAPTRVEKSKIEKMDTYVSEEKIAQQMKQQKAQQVTKPVLVEETVVEEPQKEIVEETVEMPKEQTVTQEQVANNSDPDPIAELKRMEDERRHFEEEREKIKQKEKEIAEKIKQTKLAQEDKAKKLLLEKAQQLKQQQIREYNEKIEALRLDAEKVKQEQQVKEANVKEQIANANTIFEQQISEYESQSNLIAEQEKRLAELKRIQKQKEEQIRLNYAKDIQNLEKQKAELEKESKTLNKQTITGIEKQIAEIHGKIDGLNNVSAKEIIIENIDDLKKELPIDIQNIKLEELKLDNANPSSLNSPVMDEELKKTKAEKSVDTAKVVEPSKTDVEDVNVSQNYENNFKDVNIKKEDEKTTEWLGQTLRKNTGKYDQYGSWLEVKAQNKI